MSKISALFFQTWTRYELASTRLIKINCVFGCQKIAAGAIQHFAPLIHHLMTDNVPNLLKTKSSGKTIWVLFKNVSKKTPSTWHNSSAPLQKSVKVNWTELWLRIRVIFELLLFFNYYGNIEKNTNYFLHRHFGFWGEKLKLALQVKSAL